MRTRAINGGRRTTFGDAVRRSVVGLFALTVVPLTLVACGDRDVPVDAATRIGTTPAGTQPMNVALSQVVDNPAEYLGKTVTVSGQVEDVLGPKSFTIGGNGFLAPGELLVVSSNGFPQIPNRPSDEYLVDDDIVQVTGTVRNFVRTEMTRDVDPEELEGELYVEWEGKPVLVASQMISTPRSRPGVAGPATSPLTDVVMIVTTPTRETLVGKQVQLTGVKVESVVADRSFWVGPSSSQRLFVLLDETPTPGTSAEGKVNVNPGQTLNLTGTLRRLPLTSEAQQQWGLSASDLKALKSEVIYLHAKQVQNQ